MKVIICPGIHPPELTQNFLTGLGQSIAAPLIFPADRYPAYSAKHILRFLYHQLGRSFDEPVLWIGFSAGVVGAIGAAHLWAMLGGQVRAFIALDGWGVPLLGDFPIHRLSHDAFTHWSSALLSRGEGFYAEPPVAHLELWRSPQTAYGWWVNPVVYASTQEKSVDVTKQSQPSISYIPTTAAEFLCILLTRYEE
ncbi:MAG: hypothetical protein HC865_08765 [Cyanobacteria bacterium RU_5_0]|nr:hypothetical protein [Cyanobacteria bacterium RU_5_0]